jgi:beta-lactamase regulating signal transducer with metallopeptidase domain
MVGALNAAAENWFRYMTSAAAQATLLAAFILVIVFLARRWSPALKHGLLMLALLKFAVPPTFYLPTGIFNQLRPARLEAPPSRAQIGSPAVRALWPEEPDASRGGRGAGGAEVRRLSALRPGPVPTAPLDVPAQFSTKSRFMLMQFAGALVVLLVFMRQHLRLRRLVSSAVPASDPDLVSEYSSLSRRLGFRRRPALLVSDSHNAPIAFGVWNRVILLPRNLVDALPLAEMRVILSHELAHHRRRDLWCHWLQVPLAAMWWFNPAYWLLSRTLRSVREDCCDDVVVGCGLATRDTYCRALLRAARIASGNAVPGGSFASIGESSPLQRRFRRLLSDEFSPGPKLAAGALVLIASLALLVIPGIKPGSLRQRSDCPCEPSKEIREALAALPDMNDRRLPREERLGPLRTLAERHPDDIFVQFRLQDSFAGVPALYPEIEAALGRYRSRPGDLLSRFLDARLTASFDAARSAEMLEKLAVDEPGFVWAHFERARLTDTPGFRDPAKAERHLQLFLDACPESLEGYAMLRTVDDLDMIRQGAKKLRRLMTARIDSSSLPYWWRLWDLEFRAARRGDEDELIRRVTADVAAMRSVPLQPQQLWYAVFQRAFKLTGNETIFRWAHEKASMSPPDQELRVGEADGCAKAWPPDFESPVVDDLPLSERLALVDAVVAFRQKWPDCVLDEDPLFAMLVARQYVRWRVRLDEVPKLAQQALRQAEVRPGYDPAARPGRVEETRAEANLLVAEAHRLQGKIGLAEEAERQRTSGVAIEPRKPVPGPTLTYEESLADFSATDLQGRTWRLDDLKGRATLINVWSAEGRLDDHVSLEAFYQGIKDSKTVQVLTFSRDLNPYLAERHVKANGYKFPVVVSRTLVERLFPFGGLGRGWWIIDARGRRSSPFRFTNPWLNWRLVSELMVAAAGR